MEFLKESIFQTRLALIQFLWMTRVQLVKLMVVKLLSIYLRISTLRGMEKFQRIHAKKAQANKNIRSLTCKIQMQKILYRTRSLLLEI